MVVVLVLVLVQLLFCRVVKNPKSKYIELGCLDISCCGGGGFF